MQPFFETGLSEMMGFWLSISGSTAFSGFFFFTGDSLPLASLRLLVSPLQLMTASMWQVLKKQDVMNYWKVAEFVSLVVDMVPELLMCKHRTQLNLGLRVRVSTNASFLLVFFVFFLNKALGSSPSWMQINYMISELCCEQRAFLLFFFPSTVYS